MRCTARRSSCSSGLLSARYFDFFLLKLLFILFVYSYQLAIMPTPSAFRTVRSTRRTLPSPVCTSSPNPVAEDSLCPVIDDVAATTANEVKALRSLSHISAGLDQSVESCGHLHISLNRWLTSKADPVSLDTSKRWMEMIGDNQNRHTLHKVHGLRDRLSIMEPVFVEASKRGSSESESWKSEY